MEQAVQADPMCSGTDADSGAGLSEDNPPPYLCSEKCLGVYIPVILALEGLQQQKNCLEFKVSQGYIARDFP